MFLRTICYETGELIQPVVAGQFAGIYEGRGNALVRGTASARHDTENMSEDGGKSPRDSKTDKKMTVVSVQP